MQVLSLDHIVLCVRDVEASCHFYQTVLGMAPLEERPGKWSLQFGVQKISLCRFRSMSDSHSDLKPDGIPI
jgi:catechol 2,3-dioxygenase-like lactoylglutathione lyase family enzyme